jgi:uncharacterized protein YegP (UPF0339 family)
MFNLRAENSETILTSETYGAKDSASKGIESTRKNAPIDDRYERLTSGAQYYFVLRAANNEPLGRSEMYTSAAARDNGIESVKSNAPKAPVRDLT